MPAFDAIVVLGAAVWRGGVASPLLARRVHHGVRLLEGGAAPFLLMTGGLGRHPPAEAEVMAALAVSAGVPEERILRETQARTTFESARNCAGLMRARGWSRALLVTDAFHMRRSLLAFRAFRLHVAGSAAGGALGDFALRRRLYYGAREGVGLLWYAGRAGLALRGRPPV